MLHCTLANSTEDLEQILDLQQLNLLNNISESERISQGFVTMHHDLATLKAMNAIAPAVIIKNHEKVIAYALTMFVECRHLMPTLEPMFRLFENLTWDQFPLKDYRYYVMGQICVAKEFRRKDLVRTLYEFHQKIYQPKFDLILTEISTRNVRSMKAHEKVGFKTIHLHKDALDEWAIVGWDWK
jgi:hypothetical protein